MSDEQTGIMPGTTYRSAAAWEWAHEHPEVEDAPTVPPAAVTAVMVVHDAAEWLPRQLLSLARLDPRPGSIVAVDNASTDGSAELLERARAEGVLSEVVAGASGQGFGAAVAQALDGRDPEWIWLLHDDSAPKRGALGDLLRIAAAEDADVVYPKLLMPKRRNYPDQLLEVGRSVSDTGRLVLNVDSGDIDQHQLDSHDTLGGSSAGMLVRGEVWRELGGFSPDIPLYRDGLEFGWRANQAGRRVITAPQAALYHRQSGRMGWRQGDVDPDALVADRLAALRLAAASGTVPPGWRLAGLQWARAFGYLLGKSPVHARSELTALKRFRSEPEAVERLTTRVPDDAADVEGLRPGRFSGVRHVFDMAGQSLVERYRDLRTDDQSTSLDELTGGDFAGGHRAGRRRVSPMLIGSLVLIVVALIAGRAWIGAASLSGGGLMAAPATLGDAWRAFLVPTAGVPGTSPIWLGFAALASTLTFGNPGWFTVIGSLAAPVLAMWAAGSLLRRLGVSPLVRATIGTLWGLGVIVLGFLGAGSITGTVAAIALPMLAGAVHTWSSRPTSGAERWRAPASSAGWLLLLTAVYPAAFLIAIVGFGVWGWRSRDRLAEIAVALGGPLVFLLGWLPILVHFPGRLLTGVDPLAASDFSPNMGIVLGISNAGAPHLALSVIFFVGLWVAAGLALWRARPGLIRTLGVVLIGGGYVLAGVLTRFVVPVNGGVARPEASVWLLLAVAGLLALVTADAHRERTEDEDDGEDADHHLPRLVVPVIVAVLAAGWLAVRGITGPVAPAVELLPQHVVEAQASDRATRTIMIELGGAQAGWAVVSREQPQWGTAERSPVAADGTFAAAYTQLAWAVARGQVSDDLSLRLGQLGIGHIWVRGGTPAQVAAISNAAGMTRIAADEQTQVWTVAGQPSRVQLRTGSAEAPVTTPEIAAGGEGRLLVLSEVQDSRWQAWVGGHRLATSPAATQTFVVPAAGGDLTWRMAPATAYAWLQGAVAVLLIVLAAPVIGGAPQARRGRED